MRFVKQYDGVAVRYVIVDTNPALDRIVAVAESEDLANLIVDALNAYA